MSTADTFNFVVVFILFFYCRVANREGLLNSNLQFHFRPENLLRISTISISQCTRPETSARNACISFFFNDTIREYFKGVGEKFTKGNIDVESLSILQLLAT